MSPRLQSFVCVVAAALGAVTSVQGDQASSPQQPTFVSGTQAVRVDVHATVDGQPLSDLRREELQIFEDGTLQTIQTFERIMFARPGSAPTEAARTLSRSRELLVDPRSRVFVVFLDTRHTSYLDPAVQTRFPIIKTLEKMVGPDDLVAFMTPGMRPGDLSFDRGLPALARLEGTRTYSPLYPDPAMLRDNKELLYESCYPPVEGSPLNEMRARYREKVTFDTLDDLIGYLGAVRQEPTYVIAISDGWRVFTENPQLAAALPEGPRIPKVPLGGRGRDDVGVITERGTVTLSEAALRECEADLHTLASLDHRDRLREIADHANGNNVSFYPISARGLTTTGSTRTTASKVPFENTTTLATDGVLRALADDTGGLAIVNTNNLESLLEQTMTRTSAFYLVSYSSTNSALDGKYRRITVKVNRPGVAVRARRGYVATRPEATRTALPDDSVSKHDPVLTAFGALESQVRLATEKRSAAADGVLSDAQLFRRGASPTRPFEQTFDPRFRRSERLRLAVPTRGTNAATARLLDRRGGMLAPLTQISQRPDATGALQRIEVELVLASLAIGDYAIEITSGDEVRVVAFRVIP